MSNPTNERVPLDAINNPLGGMLTAADTIDAHGESASAGIVTLTRSGGQV